MYTSAVFLGKKQKKNKKNGRIIIIIITVIITKEMFSMKNYQEPKNGYNKKSYLSFYKKVTMCNEDPIRFNLLTFKSENLSL